MRVCAGAESPRGLQSPIPLGTHPPITDSLSRVEDRCGSRQNHRELRPFDRPPDQGTITPLLANEFGRRMVSGWLS
jgi:hypothetical protein